MSLLARKINHGTCRKELVDCLPVFMGSSCLFGRSITCMTHTHTHILPISGPAEPVRPLRPWSNQKFGYLWSKSCIQRVLVGPVIVRLRFFSKGRTNLALLPQLLHMARHNTRYFYRIDTETATITMYRTPLQFPTKITLLFQ